MWKMVKLGDVLKTGAGGTPLKSKKEFYEGGTIKWLLSGAVCERDIHDSKTHITQEGLANSSAKLFPQNTVLVAMYGATAGQVGILRTKAATNQAVCGIYPSDDYLPEFIYYYLFNYKETLLLEVSGVAQPNLSQVKIKNIPLPLISLAEQKRIVVKLDAAFTEIDKAIAACDAKEFQAERLFQTFLSNLATKESGNDSVLPLKDVAKFLDYRGKTPKKGEKGIKLLTAKNVRMGYVKNQPEEFVSPQVYEEHMSRGFPKIGDVVFTTEAPLGLVAQIEDASVALGQRLITFQILNGVIQNTYLKYLLMSGPYQKTILDKGTGATVKGIKASLLKEIEITFPVSLEEQIIRTNKIETVEKHCKQLKESYEKQRSLQELLKSAILAQELQSEVA